MTQFKDLSLAEPLMRALEKEGYETPTPIQGQAIPLVMEGRDLLGIAQTGTGKTAAFALPSLHRLSLKPKRAPRKGTRMLVLAPTRELASQIAESFTAYGQFMDLKVTTVFGGVKINKQIRDLERGVDVLVATPGRLIDLCDRGALTLQHVEVLVLDEADQMLDMGFIHSLRKIVPMLPKQRQTLFFSATMPKTIADLSQKFLTDPARVSVAPAATTAERVEQVAIFVNQPEKPKLLAQVLKQGDVERALVFTRTKHGANKLVRLLEKERIDAEAIHGNKSQAQREKALAKFKEGTCRVLIATDIAARGIDVDGVSHVINYEIPNVPEQYVHRIGRTARAGAAGIAISFVAGDERGYLRDIQKTTRQDIPLRPLPEGFSEPTGEVKPVGHGGGGGRGRGGGGRPGCNRSGKPKGQRHGGGQGSGGQGGGNKSRRRRPNRSKSPVNA